MTAVIFDIDGTLVDSVDLHAKAWHEILVDYGKHPSLAEVRSQIGKGADTLLPTFFSKEECRAHAEDITKKRAALFKERYRNEVQPFPKVRELFERLKADQIMIAIASSGKQDEVAYYQKLLGIEQYVQTVATSDDANKSKPHPDIFAAVFEKTPDLQPENSLAVGDTPYDVEAAGKIGLRTIALRCGGFAEEDLRKAGALQIYQDCAELLADYADTPLQRLAQP